MRRPWLRFLSRASGPPVLLASFFLGATASSQDQAPTPESSQAARLIPNEDLVFYAEFDGLDAHATAWRKTAAYRILNETSTGAMIEDLLAQILKRYPPDDMTGSDSLAMAKHLARAGFIVSSNVWKAEGEKTRFVNCLVFRQAFANKEVRPIFAKLVQGLPAPGTKAQAVVKGSHKLIMGKRKDGAPFAWWVEETKKEDLIFLVGPPGSEDMILDTLDGKRPSVLTNTSRSDLLKPQEGFEKTGCLLVDTALAFQSGNLSASMRAANQAQIARIDFTGGFQNEALATVTRIYPKTPEVGGKKPTVATTFEKATIPSIPSGVLGFLVLALDLKSLPEQMNANPQLREAYTQMVADLRQKAKVRLEEDILGQLGPKVTAYILPAKTGGSMLPNALGVLSQLSGGGASSIPKVAILVDVANPVAFTKTLDELMGYVNRQLKTSFAKPTGPGNEAPPPPPPGGPRGRGPGAPPAPEFRVMSGETKSYVFTVPPELSSRFPTEFRPTIRVGSKQVAIAGTAEIARQALEAKGTYSPPPEISAAFGRLPSKLSWLLVVDPRESTPGILASLPAKLQAGINSVILPTSSAAPAGSASSPPPQGGNPDSSAEGRMRRGSGGGLERPGAGPAQSAPGAPATAAAPSGPLVLQVEASKLPTPDEISRLLFPAIYTFDQDGDAIRFTTREAFPPLIDPAIVGLLVRGVQLRINPNAAAAAAANPAGTGAAVDPNANRNPAPTPPPTGDGDRANRQGRRAPAASGMQGGAERP